MTEEPIHLPDVECVYCHGKGITIIQIFEAKPVGTYSLAGYQVKTTGKFWPYAVCDTCGHKSRGRFPNPV